MPLCVHISRLMNAHLALRQERTNTQVKGKRKGDFNSNQGGGKGKKAGILHR